MNIQERPLECVAFMLIRGDRVLLERRSPMKRLAPNALAIPGGHMEPGEDREEAVRRELGEELGVTPDSISYVCTLLHRAEEFRKLHYFAVHEWQGEPSPHEADALEWVPIQDVSTFDLDVDRVAASEYVRVYRP